MKLTKWRTAFLTGLLLAGCGTNGLPSGTIHLMTEAEAAAQYALLDADPTVSTIKDILAKLGVTIQVDASSTTTTTATEVTVPSNVAVVTGIDQAAPVTTTECRVTNVTASSTLDDTWFTLTNVTDGNTHSAWAPAADDQNPTLRFDLAAEAQLSGLSLKLSPVGVVVDVEVSSDNQTWTAVATGLVPVYRQLHWVNLPTRMCSHVRLHFRGVQDGHLLVCEAHPNGDAGSPTPSVTPSVTPTPAATATPTAAPSVQPSVTPSATPTPEATPSATPTPEATPTATPTPAATPAPTATPTPGPTATPTPTP
ncbi:MAG: type domain [Cyanobacteria bacterium RYN_339]|nr:type domain [Cyanobacteria bacterium RYN_339]